MAFESIEVGWPLEKIHANEIVFMISIANFCQVMFKNECYWIGVANCLVMLELYKDFVGL